MQQDTAVQGQMKTPRRLELLAPAKNIDVGQAAILAGADAVYIGGPSFGARAAAGNTMDEIASLCAFAHRFGARVYLTVNTLLYDEELDAVERMLAQAQDAGVDALIVQDPALLSMPSLQNMEIHASTQMNIDTLEKVDFCRSLHYSQIVLPREFSLEQIREFCQQRPDTRFEVFVSGAMCVSVSGICYISELMTGRSANRGACAQICRLPMTMYQRHRDSADLQEIAHGHLLSMKDNLRLAQLEDLVAAGASSFKIEGRLKDHDYVVNQVSAFRERLDRIIAKHPEILKNCENMFFDFVKAHVETNVSGYSSINMFNWNWDAIYTILSSEYVLDFVRKTKSMNYYSMVLALAKHLDVIKDTNCERAVLFFTANAGFTNIYPDIKVKIIKLLTINPNQGSWVTAVMNHLQ